jgi:hypothetical protein
VFYEFYDNIDDLQTRLSSEREQLQCRKHDKLIENSIPFGQNTAAKFMDYTDNVDTISFLLNNIGKLVNYCELLTLLNSYSRNLLLIFWT